jgi:hypothetical protein
MSGGHFDYAQYHIDRIADEVEQLILDDSKPDTPDYRRFSPAVVAEFERGLYALRVAAIYAQRIDWLVSADDGEDSFKSRLARELRELRQKTPIHVLEARK